MKQLIFFLLLLVSLQASTQRGLFEKFTTSDGLCSNHIYDILELKNQQLLLATDEGISLFDGAFFKKVSEQISVTHLVQLKDQVYALNSFGEVYSFDGSSFKKEEVSNSWKAQSAKILNQVIATNDGILVSTITPSLPVHFENFTSEGQDLSMIGEEVCYVLEVDSNLVCGNKKGNKKGVLNIDVGKLKTSVQLSSDNDFGKVRAIKIGEEGLMIAIGQELLIYEKQELLSRIYLEKPIECLQQDQEGKVWIGLFQGGLYCYSNASLNFNNRISYLPSSSISFLMEDSRRNIWIATGDDGLYQLPTSMYLDYQSPEIYTEKVNVIKAIESNIKKPKGFRLEEITPVFSKGNSPRKTKEPKVFITGIQVMGKDTSIIDELDLNHNENFLKISFGGIDHENSLLNYRFKLSGMEEEWNYTSQNFIHYTSLPHGEYVFKVEASGKSGIWSSSPAVIKLKVNQPFWERTSFIILSISFVSFCIIFLFKRRVNTIRKKEADNALINKKMADLELSALRSQMNPHFIFNTLASIQYFITQNDIRSALKYLSSFSKLLRATLDNSRKKRIRIEQEISTLKLYLELESMRFKGKFEYSIEVGEEVDKGFDDIPALIIQPYVENAIRHGVLNRLDNQGVVVIRINKTREHLRCEVEDNGIGRIASKKVNTLVKDKPESQGMNITEERLNIINAKKTGGLNVQIEDKIDELGHPSGTKVILFIPIETN